MTNENQVKITTIILIILISLFFWFFTSPPGTENNGTGHRITKDTNHYTRNAKSEVNFSIYMKNLQREIKSNWNPPKGNESRRVVVKFKVSKSGELMSYKIIQPSGNKKTDSAAIKALIKSAPFEPLPNKFKGNSVDIEFTFDYNVFKPQTK